MKFTQKTKSAIFQEARRKIGGFGMWIEVQTRIRFDNDEYYTNRLNKSDDNSDLYDFIHWTDFCNTDFEMINGLTLLDVPVHSIDELQDNLLCLINDKGDLLMSWTIMEACSPKGSEEINKYQEK